MRTSLSHILFAALLCLAIPAGAQTVLSLKDAVEIGLANNYSILLSRQDEQIARNNVTPGNAGMLPTVAASGSASRDISSNRMEMADGSVSRSANDASARYSAGLALDWTVFDGLGMFATYEKLQELALMGEATSRRTIQNTIASIITTYFDIVRQQDELDIMKSILRVSRLRLTNARDRYEAGVAARLEVLSSRVDYNTDTTALLKQEEELRNTRIHLNRLLARDVNTDFVAGDSITLQTSLEYGATLQRALEANPDIALAEISIQVATSTLKEIRAEQWPVVRASTDFALGRSLQDQGAWSSNNTRSFNYGLSASIPLFDGSNLRRRIRNAQISRESVEMEHRETVLSVETQVALAFNAYERNRMLYQVESENLSVAGENLDAAMERYRVGAISAVQLRDAQRSYLSASNRVVEAAFNAKVAEITLLQLSGAIALEM
jgi:outer membrane protein TolC